MSQDKGKAIELLIERLRTTHIQRQVALQLIQEQEDSILEEIRAIANSDKDQSVDKNRNNDKQQRTVNNVKTNQTSATNVNTKSQTVDDFETGDRVQIANKPAIFKGKQPTEKDRLATVTHITGNRWVWFKTDSGETTCRLPKNLQKIQGNNK